MHFVSSDEYWHAISSQKGSKFSKREEMNLSLRKGRLEDLKKRETSERANIRGTTAFTNA